MRMKNAGNFLFYLNLLFLNELQILNLLFSQESKKCDALNEEINRLKLSSKNVKEENDKLKQDMLNHKNHERKQEHLLVEVRKQMHDLQEKINFHEKNKVNNTFVVFLIEFLN